MEEWFVPMSDYQMRKLLKNNFRWIAILAGCCFVAGFLSQIIFFSRANLHDTLPDGLRARIALSDPILLLDPSLSANKDSSSSTNVNSETSSSQHLQTLQTSVPPLNHPLLLQSHLNATQESLSLSQSSEQLTLTQLMLSRTGNDQIPNIVKAWRLAKLDWHELLPKHNSKWERYGTPERGKGLRLLVSKETQITDFLTRFHESGLSAMYGYEHGPMLSYSGCDTFLSPCYIHNDTKKCEIDELCMWSSGPQLCVDRDKTRPSDATKQCANPVQVVGGNQGTTRVKPEQCDFYVHEPAILLTVDSESQSMFYHWWASLCMIMEYWRNSLQSSRNIHLFVREINDQAFFQFFGLFTDNCWRRATQSFAHVPPGACFCKLVSLDAQQGRNEPIKAVEQTLHYLSLDTIQPPIDRVVVGIISRRRKRFILNEYDLVASVEALGYDCVLLPFESMTLYEQMKALRSLDVLIGMHGSGLDNAIFLHPGSVLVQLLPYKNDHRCTFPSTAEQAGVHYQEW